MNTRLRLLTLGASAVLFAGIVSGCHDHPCEVDSPCYSEVLIGGVDDQFAPGNEEFASPSQELINHMLSVYYNPYLEHRFDQVRIDRPVGHTFVLPGVDAAHPAHVTKAVYSMRIKVIDPATDWFHLFVNDGNGSVRGIYDASIVQLYNGNPVRNAIQDVSIDLGALGLLNELEGGVLHMYLQDDTYVDYVKLDVEYCTEAVADGDDSNDF